MIETHASAPARVSGPAPSAPPAAAAGEKASGFSLWGDGEGFSFADLLDAVNPLQHIPILGTLYRELTGDHIGTAAKLAGGALFAGIPGLIGSAVDSIVEALSGKDIGENVLALFDGGAAPPTVLAAQTPASEPSLAEAAIFALRFDRETKLYRKNDNLPPPHEPILRILT